MWYNIVTADIDECQVNSSVCDQVCTNSAGSYTCSCELGYKLNTDNQCIGEHVHLFDECLLMRNVFVNRCE